MLTAAILAARLEFERLAAVLQRLSAIRLSAVPTPAAPKLTIRSAPLPSDRALSRAIDRRQMPQTEQSLRKRL